MVGSFQQGCRAVARKGGSLLDDSVQAGPIRVLLLTGDYRTARLIDDLLHAAWSSVHLVTHPTMDPAAAEALLDYPGCCVLVDVSPEARQDGLTLLEYVRMSAPEAPILALGSHDDESLATQAIRQGAQDYLVAPEL